MLTAALEREVPEARSAPPTAAWSYHLIQRPGRVIRASPADIKSTIYVKVFAVGHPFPTFTCLCGIFNTTNHLRLGRGYQVRGSVGAILALLCQAAACKTLFVKRLINMT